MITLEDAINALNQLEATYLLGGSSDAQALRMFLEAQQPEEPFLKGPQGVPFPTINCRCVLRPLSE